LIDYKNNSSQIYNLDTPFYIIKNYREISKKSKQRIYNREWLETQKQKK